LLSDDFTGSGQQNRHYALACTLMVSLQFILMERMELGGADVREKTVYHDGRDWAIEKHEGGYWCLPLDTDEWQEGLPPGMTVDDLNLLFAVELESASTHRTLSR